MKPVSCISGPRAPKPKPEMPAAFKHNNRNNRSRNSRILTPPAACTNPMAKLEKDCFFRNTTPNSHSFRASTLFALRSCIRMQRAIHMPLIQLRSLNQGKDYALACSIGRSGGATPRSLVRRAASAGTQEDRVPHALVSVSGRGSRDL